MEKIQLNNEVALSRIIQGLWRLKSWKMTPEALLEFVHQCIDLGVTSFDTAEIYGNYEAEAMFGEALKLEPELRSKIEIITKTGINMKSDKRPYAIGHYDTTYDKVVASCKKSIANMQGTAKFLCPGCGKREIVRCNHCRRIAAKYTCHECGFSQCKL